MQKFLCQQVSLHPAHSVLWRLHGLISQNISTHFVIAGKFNL
jgi:hypothetical protein